MVPHGPVDVLVIDDEEHVAELLAEVLSEEGYHVAVAADGLRGLEYVARYQPRLVLLDVMLPGLSGVEVLGRLRADHHHVPPVILMSAATAPADRPADVPFLAKPFDLDELLARVRAAIRPQA
jgi:DNA-binding response OmpR family regulator